MSAALFFWGCHNEQSRMKDLGNVLRWMPSLTQSGLKPTSSGLQDRGTKHQATAAQITRMCKLVKKMMKLFKKAKYATYNFRFLEMSWWGGALGYYSQEERVQTCEY